MKNYILAGGILLFFFSCHRSNDTTPVVTYSYLQVLDSLHIPTGKVCIWAEHTSGDTVIFNSDQTVTEKYHGNTYGFPVGYNATSTSGGLSISLSSKPDTISPSTSVPFHDKIKETISHSQNTDVANDTATVFYISFGGIRGGIELTLFH